MIRLLVNIHKFFYSINDKRVINGKKNFFIWLFSNIIIRACNYTIFLILQLTHPWAHNLRLNKGNSGIIVSLTSFPKRIHTVWIVIYSLFQQDVLADEIILYLSEADFPDKRSSLPPNLLALEKAGLKINFVRENLKPHKKYFYATRDYPDKMIITVDDDLYYREDLISQLLSLHRRFPTAICANTTHVIQHDQSKKIFLPYKDWHDKIYEEPVISHQLLAIGYNGVLYPPLVFHDNPYIHNMDLIKETSLNADDLWLKAQEIISKTPVCANKYYCAPPTIPSTMESSLMKTNTGKFEGNDRQWDFLVKKFDLYEKYSSLLNI